MKISESRVTSREGVNAAQALFETAGCIFQEVAQQNDFGKDAYVDIAEGGVVSHLCVALQIKSGKSFRSAGGDYFVPIDHHAPTWRRSTIPVFGLVYDPNDQLLRWADLTGYLRVNPKQEAGTIRISRDSILNLSTLRTEFSPAVARYEAVGSGDVALNLLSGNELLQADAAFDAWALGRFDARYLLLLRRLILDLRPIALRKTIALLSHATPHPDILWTKHNWIPPQVEKEVQRSFRWAPEEIVHLMRVVDISDWGRGTLGQCLDMLMYQDPAVVTKLHAAVGLLLDSGEVLDAVRAATVALAHSLNAADEVSRLSKDYPSLLQNEWYQDIADSVRQWGNLSLY